MMKLFSKNSNLCDHNSPTLQTDRQTDRQTTCDRYTALCTKVHRAVIILLICYSVGFVCRLPVRNILWLNGASWSKSYMTLTAYTGSRIWEIGTKMNDLDLCLEVVSRLCQPLRHIRRWISRKSWPRTSLTYSFVTPVQSRFAETRFTETLTLTPNPNL